VHGEAVPGDNCRRESGRSHDLSLPALSGPPSPLLLPRLPLSRLILRNKVSNYGRSIVDSTGGRRGKLDARVIVPLLVPPLLLTPLHSEIRYAELRVRHRRRCKRVGVDSVTRLSKQTRASLTRTPASYIILYPGARL